MVIQDEEEFIGVEFHTPVGSFRAGRAYDNVEGEEYREARRRVRRRMGFYRHATTFVSVLLVLFVIDFVVGRGDFWVQWVALVWGCVLALHFLNVWLFDSLVGRDAERRMIERELRKRQRSG
jgi:hypothetical protein